jgi:hypothetical protein
MTPTNDSCDSLSDRWLADLRQEPSETGAYFDAVLVGDALRTDRERRALARCRCYGESPTRYIMSGPMS